MSPAAIGPDGIYRHRPGDLSPRGVLDVGLRCPHSCRFCYYSFWDKSADQFRALRQAVFRSGADCRAILDGLAGQGLGYYDLTGGEPPHPPGAALHRGPWRVLGPARPVHHPGPVPVPGTRRPWTPCWTPA